MASYQRKQQRGTRASNRGSQTKGSTSKRLTPSSTNAGSSSVVENLMRIGRLPLAAEELVDPDDL